VLGGAIVLFALAPLVRLVAGGGAGNAVAVAVLALAAVAIVQIAVARRHAEG
jgi:hypothetical protein